MQFLLAIDALRQEEAYENQVVCAHRLVGLSGENAMCPREETPVCEWKYVCCNSEGAVAHLSLWYVAGESYDIEWIPGTTERVHVTQASLRNKKLMTRRLPRALRYIRMTDCKLSGKIELRTLPARLEGMYMKSIGFEGSVHLTHLPITLQRIGFVQVLIERVIVNNAVLPSDLEAAGFARSTGKVRFLCLDGKKVDHRVSRKTILPVFGEDQRPCCWEDQVSTASESCNSGSW